MKLFKSLLAVATVFGAGYLTHQILTDCKEECEACDDQAPAEQVGQTTAEDTGETLARELDEAIAAAEPVAEPTVKDERPFADDPKFNDAVRLVIETQKVATSLLQRRLGIGYGRAVLMIERMEEKGYVGAPVGSKPRPVLITSEEFEAALAENEA